MYIIFVKSTGHFLRDLNTAVCRFLSSKSPYPHVVAHFKACFNDSTTPRFLNVIPLCTTVKSQVRSSSASLLLFVGLCLKQILSSINSGKREMYAPAVSVFTFVSGRESSRCDLHECVKRLCDICHGHG